MPLSFLAAAFLLTAPLYTHWDRWGIFDWDQKLMEEAHARRAIVEWGELALWNPYVGGGKSAVGDPLSRHLSPLFLPILLLGELVGCRLSITLHLAIGMALSYQLSRDIEIPPIPSCVAALVGFGNGSMAWHLAYGQLEWIAAAWIPGCLLFARRAARIGNTREILASALCLALMFLEGGMYLLPPTVGAMALAAVVTAVRDRRLASVRSVVAICGAAFLLCAIKLIPTAEMAHLHPRAFDGSRRAIGFHIQAGISPTLPAQIWELFLRRTSTADSIVYRTDASCFLGLIVISLVAIGIAHAFSRLLPLLVPAAAIVWIHLGPFLPWDPWPMLGKLGPLRTLRFPERFIEVAAILVGVAAAAGLHALAGGRRWVSLLGTLAVAIDLASFGWPLYHRAFTREPAPIVPRPFAEVGFPAHCTYHTYLEGQGADRGYDVTPRNFYVHHVGEPGYRGEAYIRSGHGDARLVRLTSNRIVIDVDAPGGGLLVVNQNYDPGFSVEGGASRFVQSEGGLLAVPVRAGPSHVTFTYRPPAFVLGALISATSLAGLVSLTWREGKSRPARCGSGSLQRESSHPPGGG